MTRDCAFGVDRQKLRLSALDTVDQIGSARSQDALYTLLEGCFRSFDFDYFIISGIPLPHERLERAVVLRNWPAEWFDIYLRENFVRTDPIVRMCQGTTMPFEWREAPVPSDEAGARLIMNTACDFGLHQGFTLPIHGIKGNEACVSLGGRRPRLDEATRPALHLVAMYAYEQARRLAPAGPTRAKPCTNPLTPREREVLTWAAVGKSHVEIADILNITERTVTAHSINATVKLGAANKTQAVVKAMQSRYIRL